MPLTERTTKEWFAEAARYYLEGHQACAWCHQAHQVYRIETANGLQFHCNHCDFHVSYDRQQDRYTVVRGDRRAPRRAPVTMHES